MGPGGVRRAMDLSTRLKQAVDTFVAGVMLAIANEVGGQSVVQFKEPAPSPLYQPRPKVTYRRAWLAAVGDRFTLRVGNRTYTAKRRRDLVRRARKLGCSEVVQNHQLTIL